MTRSFDSTYDEMRKRLDKDLKLQKDVAKTLKKMGLKPKDDDDFINIFDYVILVVASQAIEDKMG